MTERQSNKCPFGNSYCVTSKPILKIDGDTYEYTYCPLWIKEDSICSIKVLAQEVLEEKEEL